MPSLISMAVASPLLELSQMDADRDRVEAAMLHAVRTRDAYLTQIASHLIVAGGKRLRPVMTNNGLSTHFSLSALFILPST